jgi:hypothetical protein
MSVILATQEAKIRKISDPGQPRQIIQETQSQKYPTQGWDVIRWYSTCLACVRSWVRSQHQKRKKKKKSNTKKGLVEWLKR